MPKAVDHDERQRELAEAVWRIIARSGVGEVTVREVAREAGWSAGTLAHYFRNKDDLLLFAFQMIWEREAERHTAGARSAHGLEALKAAVSANLCLDEESRLWTRVWTNFIARVASQPSFSEHHLACEVDWRAGMRALLADAKQLGELGPDVDVALEAEMLAAFINGLAIQSDLEPETFTPERQRELLDGYFERFRPAHPSTAEHPAKG